MTVMNNFPYNTNSPSTSQPHTPSGRAPGFAGDSYYAYQQYQQQQRANNVGPEPWRTAGAWTPDPEAYTPQGASNFSQTADWVHGPMYGSRSALPSYHAGSTAPSAITNLSYTGTEFGDNMSTISTMSQFTSGGQFGHGGEATDDWSTEKLTGMLEELIPMLGDEDRHIRDRSRQMFLNLMTRKVDSVPVLDKMNEETIFQFFEVAVGQIDSDTRKVASRGYGAEEMQRLNNDIMIMLKIFQYMTSMPRCKRYFSKYVVETTNGRALQTMFGAIPVLDPKAELDLNKLRHLTYIFMIIHSAVEDKNERLFPRDRKTASHCRNCLRHPPVITKFMVTLALLSASGRQNRQINKHQAMVTRLKRIVILCLTWLLKFNNLRECEGNTPLEKRLELLRIAVDYNIIEILIDCLERDCAGGAADQRDLHRHQSAVIKALALILKVPKLSIVTGNEKSKPLMTGIYTRFLNNDGFCKVSKLIHSHVNDINVNALQCLGHTGHLTELRNKNLSGPTADLLKLVDQISTSDVQNISDQSKVKREKVLNGAMSALALIAPLVREMLSAERTLAMLLNLLERQRLEKNDDAEESAMIILFHMLDPRNRCRTIVSKAIVESPNGVRVLLDQLSFAEIGNRKLAVKILNRLENIAAVAPSTVSTDGRHNFSTALVYGIDKYAGEKCTHEGHHRQHCPVEEFLCGAYRLLTVFCNNDLNFVNDFVRDILTKRNIILHFTQCTSESLAREIIEFATVVGGRDHDAFESPRSDPQFMRLLREKSAQQNELGRRCKNLLGLLDSMAYVSRVAATALTDDYPPDY